MFRTSLGAKVGPLLLGKSVEEQSLTGRRPSPHCISACAQYRITFPRCSVATRLQAKSVIRVVHSYRHGHTGGYTRYFRQKALSMPAHTERKDVRHVTHAKAAATAADPEESFEAILARLGVTDLREAKVKDLSAICARLGIAKSGANKGVIAARIEDFYGVNAQNPTGSQKEAGTDDAPQEEAAPREKKTKADPTSAADSPPAEVGTTGLRVRMARDSAAILGGSASSVNLLRLRKRPEREWAPMLSTLTNGELAAILQAHGGGTEPGKKGTLHLSKQSLLTMLSNLIRDGKDEDSGASLELPKPQNYSALDIWAYNSAEELKALLDQASDVKLEQMLAERSLVEEGESREEQVAKLEVQLAEEWALLDGMATMTDDEIKTELNARGYGAVLDMDEDLALDMLFTQLVDQRIQEEKMERENAELLSSMGEALEAQWARTLGPYMRVAVLCGGPGLKREATMDYARTAVAQLDTLARFGDAVRDGFRWLDTEKYGISVTPYYFGASGRVYPLTIEQLHAKSADDLEYDVSQQAEDQGYTLEELMEHLKEGADITLPALSPNPEEAGAVEAALAAAQLPFVGSSAEALALAADRRRTQERLQELGFPTVSQVRLSAEDFEEDPMEACQQWQAAIDAQIEGRILEAEEALLAQSREPLRVTRSPFSTKTEEDIEMQPSTSGAEETQLAPGADSAQPGASGAAGPSGAPDQAVIDVEGGAALATAWGRKLRDWAGADLGDPSRTYVVKPAAVGLASVPGEFVFIMTGLPQAAVSAFSLIALGLESVVVEPHFEGHARVSIAVVEGSEGPVALLPTQEEVVSPEADFLDANVEAQRKLGQAEGYSEQEIESILTPLRQRALYIPDEGSAAVTRAEAFPDTRLRQRSPPDLPPELLWSLRMGAIRLFKELGLRDAAVFEAWVDMPQVPEVAPEEEAEEDVYPRVTALPSFKERTYPRETAVLTSKDLERAARVHEPDEITYDYQGEILPDGSEGYKHTFDQVEDELDTLDFIESLPENILDDADDDSAEDLCRWDTGTIMFDSVHATLDLSPSGHLFRQAAELGITHEAALRSILANASRRAGLAAIPPPLPDSLAETMFMKLPPPRDYDAEQQQYLEEQKFYDEKGELNEELLARPDEIREEDYADPEMEENALFVPTWAHPKFGDRLDVGMVRQIEDGIDALEDQQSQEPELPRFPGREEIKAQPVWILMGGDSPQRQASLASGLNAFMSLRHQAEIQPELFMLAPRNAGARQRDRRRTLLKRRADLLELVGVEAELPEELQLPNIRRMPLPDHAIGGYGVWALPLSHALHATVEDIHEMCEAALGVRNKADHVKTSSEKRAEQFRLYVQQQAAVGGLHGVAGTWEGEADQPQPAPRYMDMESFALEADAKGAVVLLALHGGLQANGAVQRFLEEMDVPFTGPSWQSAYLCGNQEWMAEALAELEVHNISTAPKFGISYASLEDAATSQEACEHLFEQMKDAVGGTEAIVIKPAEDSDAAQAPLAEWTDLALYARGIVERQAAIPPDLLSLPHGLTPLPLEAPMRFVAEPYVATDNLEVKEEDGKLQGVEWTGNSRWMPVTIGLVGPTYGMQAIGPTLRLTSPYMGGGMMRFTPPPAHLARPEVLKGVCDRAKMVADALGLNGVAQLDAFMHADSADLVLVNAHAIPDMSPASDIFQQWEATTEVRLMETEEGEQVEQEDEGARTPAELLRKLIFYAQFHDPPEQSAPGPEDNWDYTVPGGTLQDEDEVDDDEEEDDNGDDEESDDMAGVGASPWQKRRSMLDMRIVNKGSAIKKKDARQ